MVERDEFLKSVKESLAKRAAFICSNLDCRVMTVGPTLADDDRVVYIGKAAHVHAAAPNGPRYNPAQTSEERAAIGNAIFLCSNCADMIDRNGGVDYSAETLRRWKTEHEEWVRGNLNKRTAHEFTIVDGEHVAEGKGEVVGLDIDGLAFLQPGTRSRATGEGLVIGTRIGSKKRE